jgi:hypothetical protein
MSQLQQPMIPVLTKLQVDKITLSGQKPLLICDVDEVIVHFVNDFEAYLDQRGYALMITDAHLSGRSIQSKNSGGLLEAEHCYAMIGAYFAERTHAMQPIAGAIDAISEIAGLADVVFLTNLPAEAGDARRKNLSAHGLEFPVITNSGPKGPAIRALAAKTQQPVAFVDDSPSFLKSSFEYAPHVTTVHFLQDERFLPFAPQFDFLGHRSNNWPDTLAFLNKALASG